MAVVGSADVKIKPDFSEFGPALKSGLIAGLAGLAPAIAPAVGILGALPGAALAGASAIAVLKLSFDGVGKALKDSSTNAKAFQKDMAGLTPGARDLVNQLIALKPALNDIKTSVQNGLLPGAAAGLRSATGDLAIFKAGLTGTAVVVGNFFRSFGALIASPSFKSDLPGLFKTSNQFLASLGAGFLHIIDITKNVAVAAEPLLLFMGKSFDDLTAKIDKFTSTPKGKADLKAFFNETISTLKTLGSIIGSVLGILKDLITPFFATSKQGLGGVADGLASVKKYLDGIPADKIKLFGEMALGFAAVVKFGGPTVTLLKSLAPVLGLVASPAGLIVLALAAIAAGLAYLYITDKPFRTWVNSIGKQCVDLYNQIVPIVKQIIADFMKYWGVAFGPNGSGTKFLNELKKDVGPIFSDIKEIIVATCVIIQKLWHAFGQDILNFIFNTLTAILKVTRGAFDVLGGLFKLVADLLSGRWGKLWGDIKQICKGAWEIVQGLFLAAKTILYTALDAIRIALTGIWGALWLGIKTAATTGWNAVVTFFTVTAKNAIVTAFNAVVGAVQTVWNKITSIFSGPINIVIDIINAFDGTVDRILSAVGLGSPLPSNIGHVGGSSTTPTDAISVSQGQKPKGFATGGVVGGRPTGRDTQAAMLTPGEFVMRESAVRKHGLAKLYAMNDGGQSSDGRHYSVGGFVGGILGGIGDGIGGAFNYVKNGVVDAASFVGDAALHYLREGSADIVQTMYNDAIGPSLGLLKSFGIGGSLAKGQADAIAKKVVSFIRGHEHASTSSAGPYNASGGVAQWATYVYRVLKELHSPSSFDAVMARIAFESGGNPNAINLTDSNAAAGHPSQGLLQTIPSTFAAYAGPYLDLGITNGLANIYAGVNYADQRYGGMPDPRVTHAGYNFGGPIGGIDSAWFRGNPGEFVLSKPTVDKIGLSALTRLNSPFSRSGRSGGSGDNGAHTKHVTLQHVEHQHVYSPSDADLIARQLEFSYRLGTGV